MAQFIVIYDSCVLYPAPLRDLLMRLALTDLYHAKWTQEIHKEWMRNLLKNRPDLTAERLESVRGRSLRPHISNFSRRSLASALPWSAAFLYQAAAS